MIQLFIDTTGMNQTVALMENRKVFAQKKWRSNYNESEVLLPAITSLLNKVKKTFSDLEQVVVARGPGSFSSTRIGVTVANILGFALGIPVIGSLSNHGKLDTKKRIVTPLYAKLPNITKGKGIWSQVRLPHV